MKRLYNFLAESIRNPSLDPRKEPIFWSVMVAGTILVGLLTGDVDWEELAVFLVGLFARGRVSPA